MPWILAYHEFCDELTEGEISHTFETYAHDLLKNAIEPKFIQFCHEIYCESIGMYKLIV